MMKKFAALFLLCGSLALAGCDDRDAREYAKRLADVLDTYQTELDRKVSAEKASYKELAAVYEQARRSNVEESLDVERSIRSKKLATLLVRADDLPRQTDILDSLHDYAEHDLRLTRDFLQTEADAQAQFLGDIEALEFESETIDELRESLKQLAKPKGQLKRLRDAAVFAQDSKKELDKLTCQDLDTRLTALRAQLAKTTDAAERKHIQTSIAEAEAEKKEKCS